MSSWERAISRVSVTCLHQLMQIYLLMLQLRSIQARKMQQGINQVFHPLGQPYQGAQLGPTPSSVRLSP